MEQLDDAVESEKHPEEVADQITDDIMENKEEVLTEELTLKFSSEELKNEFVVWLLDAGGEQDFFSYLQFSDIEIGESDPIYEVK
jgi:S-adenosylmethionine synthetase